MEGITILNTIESTSMAPIGTYIVAGCIFGMLVLAIIGIGYINSINAAYFIGGAAAFLLIVIFTCMLSPRETSIAYQVLIDKSVSLVEFNEHYNIINRQGDIYTIIEKDFSK